MDENENSIDKQGLITSISDDLAILSSQIENQYKMIGNEQKIIEELQNTIAQYTYQLLRIRKRDKIIAVLAFITITILTVLIALVFVKISSDNPDAEISPVIEGIGVELLGALATAVFIVVLEVTIVRPISNRLNNSETIIEDELKRNKDHLLDIRAQLERNSESLQHALTTQQVLKDRFEKITQQNHDTNQ